MSKVEYLIVGQGLAGTMLGFEMLNRGIDFRIVSSAQKSKASVVAAGMINPLVFKRLTKSWMLDDLLPFMTKRYNELEQILGSKFYFSKHILKPLSEQETELWRSKAEQTGFASYIGKILDVAPVDSVTDAFAYGIVNGAGYLNLKHFLESAEDFFTEKGLLVYDDLQINTANEKSFRTNSGQVEAGNIIFCDGYHLHKNPLFDFVKMNPAKGEVLQIYAPDLSEDYILNKKVFVLPIGEKRFKVGSTYEWDDLSEEPTNQGKESILERLDALISVKYKIENHWAGVRPTIFDRRPVLGQHPNFKKVYVFNGLGTKGVMLAPFFAHQMGDFLTKEDYSLSPEIDVKRFVK